MRTADEYGYCERERIKEFLGEHEVVKALYEVARKNFEQWMDRRKLLLRLFNAAFFVCMRLTDGSGRSLGEPLDECPYARGVAGSPIFRNNLFSVIYSLLRVHQGLLPVRGIDRSFFKIRTDDSFDWSDYGAVICRYEGTLTRPIDFSGRTAGASQAPSVTEQVAEPDESDPMQLVVRATSDLVKAHGLMKEQLAAKDARVQGLEERLDQERKRLAEKDARVKELEERLDLERKRRAGSEARVRGLEERNASLSSNPFCLDKLKDYAKGVDKEEAKVITHMLLTIALDEQLPKARQAEVRKAVKEVEAAHRKQVGGQSVYIEHQEIHNDNQQSQVFNGSITDSNFGK